MDVDAIKGELDQLSRERDEVDERIRALSGRGRGRGRGDMMFGGRGRGRPPPFRGEGPYRDGPWGPREGPYRGDGPYRGEQPTRGEGPYRGPPGAFRGDYGPRSRYPGPPGEFHGQGGYPPQPADPPVRRKLSSAVVVGGETRTLAQPSSEPLIGLKRPAPEERQEAADPQVKRRNQRMFGSLLGTLAKFKQEDAQFRGSQVAQRRQEMQAKAEQRAAEAARTAREGVRADVQAKRLTEISRKREINLRADMKIIELVYAQKVKHHVHNCAFFLRTSTSPPVFWLPSKPNDLTRALADRQQQELEEWKAAQLEQMEAERGAVEERMQRLLGTGQGEAAQGNNGTAEGREGEEEKAADMEEEGGEAEAGDAGQGDEDEEGDQGGDGNHQPSSAVDNADRYDPEQDGVGEVENEQEDVLAEAEDEEVLEPHIPRRSDEEATTLADLMA